MPQAESVPRPDPMASDPRVALAEERTLLAWIRTGVALMGFGFVVARFGVFLRELVPDHVLQGSPAPGASAWMGAGLVALGVTVNVAAAVQHIGRLRMLKEGTVFRPNPTFGVALSLALAAIGFAMTAYLLTLRA